MSQTYGSFNCQNCGRSQVRTQKTQKFCPKNPNGTHCKDRYWSRGTRRVSRLAIQVNKIMDILQTSVETSALLLDRIEKLETRMVPFGNLNVSQILRMIEDFQTHREQIDHSRGK